MKRGKKKGEKRKEGQEERRSGGKMVRREKVRGGNKKGEGRK